jgi:membrane-associated phospholipid phosphatase
VLNNRIPFLFYLLLLSVCFYFIFNYSKVEIHLFINKFVGNAYLDVFFKYITYIGDGWFVPMFILLITIINLRLALTCLLSFLVAVIISITLKYIFFDDVVRPWHTFQWTVHEKINYVDGVKLYLFNSFPSGHSTQAFAIFIPLLLFVKKTGLKLLILLIALMAAFSRTYLSMHWLEDIVAGSFIGFTTALVVYYLIFEKNKMIRLNMGVMNLKSNKTNEK